MSCKKFYDDMLVTRDYWVSRARRSAALTIPYLIPRSNEPVQENMDTYVLPWNGIGARGTTNLASKLLMALLPPTEEEARHMQRRSIKVLCHELGA